MPSCVRAAAPALLAAAILASPSAQTRITTPREQLGFSFGDDYQLANYAQIADYWRKLDAQSDRMAPSGDWQDRRGAAAPDGNRDLARQSQEPREVSRHLTPPGVCRRRQRRRGTGALARRESGRLDRRRTARDRNARRAATRRDGLPDGQPDGRRDAAGSSTSASSSSSTPTRTATTSSPIGTCGIRIR